MSVFHIPHGPGHMYHYQSLVSANLLHVTFLATKRKVFVIIFSEHNAVQSQRNPCKNCGHAGLQIAAYSRFCTRNILTIFSRPLLSDICMFYNVIPLTAYCQHTDIIVTAYWYHTNRILTSYWENTDSTLTFHWFHTNIKLTPTWYHTKVLLMNHWIHWIHSTIITSLHWHHTDQKCI